MKLQNKTVFITGASSGIGLACAAAFAEQGANLVICARRKEKIEAAGGKAEVI
jgi:NAD(P)-dependent dehydrogenase (short-subunit alcohol dehydrogenase family)